jgi:hypothetical protein|tara:strand:- start:12548 stop:14035 length:1488 start_codon:yes stop_codon:yes gene_type:complete
MGDEIEKILEKVSPYYKKKKGKASMVHKLVYNSPSDQLEPFYFWILDFMGKIGFSNPEKLIDNFASSPGSGHFSELGQKKSQMQQESSRIMATINTVLRSVLNLLYDLKEFKIRLDQYEAANSKDKSEAEAGRLSLKQIWMDKVDIQRGQGSINALSSGNLQFVTLRDAFLVAKTPKDVDKIDLNDRVKRILKPRVQEFNDWKDRSHSELKKRFEIEKTYLRSQVDSLRLQARWAKPYLKAAEKLAQEEGIADKDAALVTAFNTVILQLTLFGKRDFKVGDATTYHRMGGSQLPEEFKRMKKIRPYYIVVIVDFRFIGIPQKTGQHYTMGGKAEIEFKSYALNEDEIKLMEAELDKSDVNDALKLVQGMTDDSLAQLEVDLDEFLETEKEDKKEKDTNPFSELFNLFPGRNKKSDEEKDKEKTDKLKKKGAKKDSYAEKYVRNLAIIDAMDAGFLIYDTLKKSYGMGSFPFGGGSDTLKAQPTAPKGEAEKFFGV